MVILHLNTPEMEAMAITSPLTAIASDAGIHLGKGHPRTAGTYARVLGYYVREKKALSLMDAIRKIDADAGAAAGAAGADVQEKGRIKVGADADISVFDPATVIDHATYEKPARVLQRFPVRPRERGGGGKGWGSGIRDLPRARGPGSDPSVAERKAEALTEDGHFRKVVR